jgi:hypothetical protein
MTREELNELMDEFYGDEETGEGGVYEDNYELAEWARAVVPELFDALADLLDKKDGE